MKMDKNNRCTAKKNCVASLITYYICALNLWYTIKRYKNAVVQ